MQQLSLRSRPRRFAALLGQEEPVEQLAQYHATYQNLPVATLFSGPSGVGKTSLARVCAAALECEHNEFGTPCKKCYAAAQGSTLEINCGDFTGIDKMREFLSGSGYAPLTAQYRSYIIDEAHGLSQKAQGLLYKYLEDSPETTKYYLCTTDPDSIHAAILGRCQQYNLRLLTMDEIAVLVERLLTRLKSDLEPQHLVEVLEARAVRSPRDITQAVEKYAGGAAPEAAVTRDATGGLNTLRICQRAIRGDWERLGPILSDLDPSQARIVRRHLAKYLKTMLIEDSSSEVRARASKGIARLTQIVSLDNDIAVPAVVAGVHDVAALFAK